MDGILREVGRLDVDTQTVSLADLPDDRKGDNLKFHFLTGFVRHPRLQQAVAVPEGRNGSTHVVRLPVRSHFAQRKSETGIVHIRADLEQHLDGTGDGQVLRQRLRDKVQDVIAGTHLGLEMAAPSAGRREDRLTARGINRIPGIIVVRQATFFPVIVFRQAQRLVGSLSGRQVENLFLLCLDRPVVELDPLVFLDDIGTDLMNRKTPSSL